MTDPIDRMVRQVDASYGGDTDPSPATQAYLQTCATLELARQQRETNIQLTRIADALDRPAPPDLREMTRNSLRREDLSEV